MFNHLCLENKLSGTAIHWVPVDNSRPASKGGFTHQFWTMAMVFTQNNVDMILTGLENFASDYINAVLMYVLKILQKYTFPSISYLCEFLQSRVICIVPLSPCVKVIENGQLPLVALVELYGLVSGLIISVQMPADLQLNSHPMPRS